jgi:hypothetical protein
MSGPNTQRGDGNIYGDNSSSTVIKTLMIFKGDHAAFMRVFGAFLSDVGKIEVPMNPFVFSGYDTGIVWGQQAIEEVCFVLSAKFGVDVRTADSYVRGRMVIVIPNGNFDANQTKRFGTQKWGTQSRAAYRAYIDRLKTWEPKSGTVAR